MSHKPISSDALLSLLKPHPVSNQSGPLRWYDKEMRCVTSTDRGSRRYNCGSPTYLKLEGVPICSMHALRRMNEMLTEREVEESAGSDS